MGADGQAIIADARAGCRSCPYHEATCAIAPLVLLAGGQSGERREHPHADTLERHLGRLKAASARFERDLLAAMGSDDEGQALVAGCLLAQAFWDEPERVCRLLDGIAARGPDVRMLSGLEEQLMRAGALLQDPGVPPLLRGRYRVKRGDRDISVLEAVRLVTRLIGGELPAVWFTEAVPDEDRGGFEASFALREKAPGDESEHGGGSGAIDLFFSAREGSHAQVYYYRRDGHGKQALVSVDQIRPDSLLTRLFKVFYTDQLKTHRLFARICRFLNNGFKGLDKRMLWEGLKRLEREQQIVLALYAPRLGKYIEKRAKFPGLYRLSKFLHRNVSDKAGKRPCHARIFEQRALVHDVVELYGKQTFKEFCVYVFRIAEATPDGPQWSDLIFKIGEVAYFLTAVEGFNPAGLELGLNGKNPLAFVAYGMQPPAKAPARRLQRLREARARLARDEAQNQKLIAACDQGLIYMAEIHGHQSLAAMEQAVGAAATP